MEPLRIGLAGAGGIGQHNLREAMRIPETEVVGVFDPNHKVARDLARTLSIPFFASYEELLGNPELEAVLLCVPNHLHQPMIIDAAEEGKHVLVERPLANDLPGAEQVVERCSRAGVALTVNLSLRYLPSIVKARELVAEGALGEVYGVQIISHIFKDRGYWDGARSSSPDDWRKSSEKRGFGLTLEPVSHYIDAVSFITGLRIARAYSEHGTFGPVSDIEDVTSISCRFDNGAIGTIATSSTMRGPEQIEMKMWGARGTVGLEFVKGESALTFNSTRRIDNRRPGRVHRLTKFPKKSWTADWMSGFARAVREGRRPDVSLREGWESLAFIATANRSLDAREPLSIPEFPAKYLETS